MVARLQSRETHRHQIVTYGDISQQCGHAKIRCLDHQLRRCQDLPELLKEY
jgi:hypothetical protein